VALPTTATQPITRDSDEEAETSPRPALAVVLDCDAPGEAGDAATLDGIDRVVIGRGDARRLTRTGRELRVHLADGKASGKHAEIDCRGGYALRDVGSTNGTFLGAARITQAALTPGAVFRVGRTFLTVVADGAPVSARAPGGAPPWPFATAHGGFRRELDQLERIAPSSIPVMLLGETGTGKEVLARAAHDRSGRPGPFIAVNCGALPATLIESLLFGHKKGAFSGAVSDEPGFVRKAHRGTLFLDEIGDLPLAAQASLLRVLQEREVTPVGATEPVQVDLRVLCATHRPLDAMVREGRFRADLYSRLSGKITRIPPLRERRFDLGTIVARTLGERARGVRVRVETGLLLLLHDYPHNVRELTQALEAALVLSADGVLRPVDLPESLRASELGPAARVPVGAPLDEEDQRIRDELVRRLAERGGNISQVARDMGKARQQVQRWMRRFGLDPSG
jgi:sigma-54 dependent transcriptional regulator, acetoin dehydrogenase operon transcriptional activator AcoR